MVAMEPEMRGGPPSIKSLLLALLLCGFAVAVLVPRAFGGAWTVWDLGPEPEVDAVVDDRAGGVWMALHIIDPRSWIDFDSWLLRVSGSGTLNLVAPPDGWKLSPLTSDWEWGLWCRQGRLVAPLWIYYDEPYNNDRMAVWEYDGVAWNLALDPASVPVRHYWNAMDWVKVTSDNKWSAGFSWSSGGSCPSDYAALINLIGGELVEVDTASSYRDYSPGYNDGASWVESLLGYSSSWKRVDWTGTTKQDRHYEGCLVITPHGTWLSGYSHWPPGTGFQISELSFARGLLWEADLDGRLGLAAHRPFGAGFYLIYDDQLCELRRCGDGWRIDSLSLLPTLPAMEDPLLVGIITDSAGNLWMGIKYICEHGPSGSLKHGYGIAVYDRSDELIDPTITLTVGLDVIEPQDTTVVNASIAPGQRTYDADVYAVVQTPSGELWSYPWTEQGIHPMAENLHFDPHTFVSDFILLHIEPPMSLAFGEDGQYTVYVALTEPGTLNPIGEIAYVPFELALAR